MESCMLKRHAIFRALSQTAQLIALGVAIWGDG